MFDIQAITNQPSPFDLATHKASRRTRLPTYSRTKPHMGGIHVDYP